MEKLWHLDLMKLNIKKLLNKNTSTKKSPEVIRDFFVRLSITSLCFLPKVTKYKNAVLRHKKRKDYLKLVAKNLSKSAPLKSLATIVPLGSIKKLAGILWIPN